MLSVCECTNKWVGIGIFSMESNANVWLLATEGFTSKPLSFQHLCEVSWMIQEELTFSWWDDHWHMVEPEKSIWPLCAYWPVYMNTVTNHSLLWSIKSAWQQKPHQNERQSDVEPCAVYQIQHSYSHFSCLLYILFYIFYILFCE